MSSLAPRANHLIYLILTAVSEEKNIKKEGTTTRFIVLELVDDKGKIRCALFGDYVDIVNKHLAITGTELPVVIIQFAKVNLYKGEVGLINLFNTSRLLWNPQIPEAIQFKQSLAVHEIEVDLAIGVLDGDSPVNIRDEFLNYFSRKTIEALQVCEEDGFFIVLGTITAILEDGKWSYSACSCNKSVNVLNKESKEYYCTGCCTIVTNVTPRYKLKLVVSDETESATFVLFDSHCRYLLNKSCKDMLSLSKGSSSTYPEEFRKLVGRELLFKIQIDEGRALSFEDSFKVKKICVDLDVIHCFKFENSIVTPDKLKFRPKFTELDVDKLKGPINDEGDDVLGLYSQKELSTMSFGECSFGNGKKDLLTLKEEMKTVADNGHNYIEDSEEGIGICSQAGLSSFSVGQSSGGSLNDIESSVEKILEDENDQVAIKKRRLRAKAIKIEMD